MHLVNPKIGEVGDIDTAITTLKFANGAIGVIDNSRQAVYGYDQRVEVFGEKGNLTCENDRPTTVEISNEHGTHKDTLKHFFLDRYADAYVHEVNAFVESIIKNESTLCNGNDGLQAELIAKAAKQSYLEGKPIQIN